MYYGVSDFMERATFKTDDDFHLSAYHYVAYKVRSVRFGRCDAAGTVTARGRGSCEGEHSDQKIAT